MRWDYGWLVDGFKETKRESSSRNRETHEPGQQGKLREGESREGEHFGYSDNVIVDNSSYHVRKFASLQQDHFQG